MLLQSSLEASTSLGLRVRRIDPQTDRRWQDFVFAHPEGLIYHHPMWIKAIEAEYEQPPEHLACETGDGRLLAILPLLHTRGFPLGLGGALAGRRLCSLPRTPLAGPLSIEKRATVELLREAARLARNDGAQLQIKVPRQELDGLVDGLVFTPWRQTYILKLPEKTGAFRIPDAKERSRVKWAINKAAKLGLRVRPAETEADVRRWYRLYLDTMRRAAVPPRAYRFFTGIWKSLRPSRMMELLLAEHGTGATRTVVAGAVFLMLGTTMSYSFSAMSRQHASLRANDVIQWHAINDACRRGFRRFDFGEVPEGHNSLARFKKKWGAEPERLYRYYAPAPSGPVVDSPGRLQSVAEAIWRRLPLQVTAWLGDRVYSYL